MSEGFSSVRDGCICRTFSRNGRLPQNFHPIDFILYFSHFNPDLSNEKKRKKSSFLFFVILICLFCTLARSFCFSLLAGMTSAFIWQVSSGSSESGNATSLPALESSSSSESLATFRAEIAAENEAEIYARIRSLQSRDYYKLPPQNSPGEYEGLVRDHLDQALNVPHYRNILDMEYLELTVLERKGLLQDRLFNLMLGEQKISRITELSPYTNIRMEAYDFLEGKVEPVVATFLSAGSHGWESEFLYSGYKPKR